jgi:type I restriction enzyme M protein
LIEGDQKDIFQINVERGVKKGILKLTNEDKTITYVCNRSYSANFSDPEEKIRAAYFVELIEDYYYEQKKINLGHCSKKNS